jgi:hypothetical protein
MLVVLPFCTKDEALTLKNLEWVRKLDKKVPYKALIVHDELCDGSEVMAAASQYFSDVEEFKYSHWTGRTEWPFPQNFQFQQTVGYIFTKQMREPWFWWEADATPIKAGWLETIDKAHQEGGKLFSGNIVGEPYGHMTGVGVYPWDLPCRSGRVMMTDAIPWDVAGKPEVVPHCHKINDIIQHIWERDGAPFSFKDKADVEQTVNTKAVIFHRCKDGSLIDILNGEPLAVRIAKFFGVGGGREGQPDTAVMTLGRYGDIINSLPIARYLYETTGRKPAFIAAEECVGILDGVTYVEPVCFRGHYGNLTQAIAINKPKFKNLVVAQVYGRQGIERHTDSFCKEAWELSGMLPMYGKTLPYFDNRDNGREQDLVKSLLKQDKQNILVNLTGHSSPFVDASHVMYDIQRRWGDVFNVVDIGQVKAHRIYDLLGLIDAADLLITTDTATLHLAAASATPYVAFIADRPDLWYGSNTLGECKARIRYSEALMRIEEMHQVIHSVRPHKEPFFWHVLPDFWGSGDTFRRNSLALESWKVPYSTGAFRPVFVHDRHLYRMWEKDGPNKKLPFLKDVIERAAWQAPYSDYILLTNTDTCFSPTIDAQLREAVKRGVQCGYSHRRDFARLEKLLDDATIKTGHSYPGKDLFLFTKAWWEKHRNEMPDMIYGAEAWDALLAILIKDNGGEVWTDMIYHERHDSYWERAENRYTVPSQIHCLALAKQFCKDHGKNPEEYGFR